MSKQIKHIRRSKYGRPFLAGSNDIRNFVNMIIKRIGFNPPERVDFREVRTIKDAYITSPSVGVIEAGIPKNFFSMPKEIQKAVMLHESLHIKYPEKEHRAYFQTDYINIGREIGLAEDIISKYKIGFKEQYKEIEFVCANPDFPNYNEILRKHEILCLEFANKNGLLPYRQCFENNQFSFAVIIMDEKHIPYVRKRAREMDLSIDAVQNRDESFADMVKNGELEYQV